MSLLFKKYFSLAIIFNDKLNKVYLRNVNNKLDAFLNEVNTIDKAPMVALSQFLVNKHKLVINPEDWRVVALLNQIDQIVSTTIVTGFVSENNNYVDVECYDINNLPNNIIPNLKWIIPLCIDKNNINCSVITK